MTEEQQKSLDYSEAFTAQDTNTENVQFANVHAMEENRDEKVDVSSVSRRFFSFFENITKGRQLDASDLAPVMMKMKEHLMKKNVAANISQQICDAVTEKMIGRNLGTFERVQSVVLDEINIVLTRILTPATSTDLLLDIENAKNNGRLYTIVFVGVNGVGKSTNLSKVCFWLLQNKLRVLIAACDTFRSGAVEQLGTHVRNLRSFSKNIDVELYEKGYGKDSASIAKDAIRQATTDGYDVVLIDTAGRMQDNEPLMRALAKLVGVNQPDKILFVGEALVGNEAISQLTKFNKALKEYAGKFAPRQIDGIILSKFDTVDDKIGAALSMTFITGKPIFFIGTGQTYMDLKRIHIGQIVQSLLSD